MNWGGGGDEVRPRMRVIPRHTPRAPDWEPGRAPPPREPAGTTATGGNQEDAHPKSLPTSADADVPGDVTRRDSRGGDADQGE